MDGQLKYRLHSLNIRDSLFVVRIVSLYVFLEPDLTYYLSYWPYKLCIFKQKCNLHAFFLPYCYRPNI